MIIRTTSQLPPNGSEISNESLVEISVPVENNLYESRSVTFDEITNQIVVSANDFISQKYSLTDSDEDPIDISNLQEKVNALYSADNVYIDGVKIFISRPIIDDNQQTGSLNANNVATVNDVNYIIRNSKIYSIGSTSYIGKNPLLNGGIDQPSHFTDDTSTDMLYFHIDDGKNDSSTSVESFVQAKSNTVCNHNGQLVMYGWIAQQGDVEPQNAWVALCGKVQVGSSRQWVILQLHPWHTNSNSTKMQYVSFNINVKVGLELKIKTGFNVDASNGGFQYGNSLGFSNNTPNTFVGYILHDSGDR